MGVVLSSHMAFGTQVADLVITENSSTSLTAMLTGTTVTVSVAPGLSDSWTLTFSTSLSAQGVYWLEPGSQTSANIVELGNSSDQLIVSSEVPAPPSGALNNGQNSSAFFLNLPGGGQEDMVVTFNDNGDSARVPDATSTLPLLSLSLAGLGFLARRLKA